MRTIWLRAMPFLLSSCSLLAGPLAWAGPPERNSSSNTTEWQKTNSYVPGSLVLYSDCTWRAVGRVSPGCAPLGSGDGSAQNRTILLAQRVGFGKDARGGGMEGKTWHVTTPADSGPGSLREALARPEPLWIVFDGDYVIRLNSGLPVSSEKTIDGRGRKITITGHSVPGLIFAGVHDVIVANLILHDFGDTARTKLNDTPDAILIQDRAHDIWIDHCTLSKAGDKLIGIHGGCVGVTVSWCHFLEQQQVFQVGTMTTQKEDAEQCVTVHHNFFERTGYRNPVVSYGKVHAFNNYLFEWQNYGMRAQRLGQLLSEANIFEAGQNTAAIRFDTPGNGWNDPRTLFDKRPGAVRSVGDLKLNKAKIRTREPGSAFNPAQFYQYQAEQADVGLKERIRNFAGWQAVLWEPLSKP